MYYSFIMLKPDAVERGLALPILAYFQKAGIALELADCRKTDTRVLFEHYADVIRKMGPEFEIKYANEFTNRYVMPMVVKSAEPELIARIRKLVGATDPSKAAKGTIRGDFGQDSFEKCSAEGRCCRNLIHASDSPESLYRELKLWFGEKYAEKYGK